MARKAIPVLPDPPAPPAPPASLNPLNQIPELEQSWIPPALLRVSDGYMIASLRGIRRLPLNDDECAELFFEWRRRGEVALSSTEVATVLGWPQSDFP